jgi:hypothetical protein
MTMELKSPLPLRSALPVDVIREFYCNEVSATFSPSNSETGMSEGVLKPTLFTVDLYKALNWLEKNELAKPIEKNVCDTPVLLFAPKFATDHLLFHYDGSSNSISVIKRFIALFSNVLHDSKATIISPSFIPKSKLREEQEIIQLIAAATKETSFIKFNFTKIGDFWSYGGKHGCTLLVTTKKYQEDLARVLFQFYKGRFWNDSLSFFLSA